MERGDWIDRGKMKSGEGLFVPGQQPFEMDGVMHFPATECHVGRVTRDDNGQLVQLHLTCDTLAGNQIAAFIRMSPEGARTVAAGLIAAALQVETHVAEQALLLIEAARHFDGGRP